METQLGIRFDRRGHLSDNRSRNAERPVFLPTSLRRVSAQLDLHMRPSAQIFASVLVLLVVPGIAFNPPRMDGAETARRPNIVLILADDLGYGDLGCYGQKRIATPHIDRLAAEGRRFTQFYAGSTVCAPSRCVLMTGLHTGHCYIRGNSDHSLRANDATVAELLKTAGYATGLFGKWGLGQEGSAGVPTRKGFDRFFGYLDQAHAHNYFPAFLIADESREPLQNVVPGRGPYGSGVATKKIQYSADLIRDRALQFIDEHKSGPFFLEFASTLPHANNESRPNGMEIPDYGAYRDKSWPEPEKGHAAMISRLDSDVGRLLSRLREHGLENQTIVLFTSDNGGHSEGGHNPRFFDDMGPLRGHKRDLYEGGIREPLIVRWPGRVPADTVSTHIGYFGDLFATVGQLAGVTPPPGLDSISFLPSLEASAGPQLEHEFLYWEFHERGSTQAVRLGTWKGVIRPMGSRHVELYDLATDLGETRDVAAAHPEIVEKIVSIAKKAHTPSQLWPDVDPKAQPRRPARTRSS
ncbi:MAG TPA: arylsulfatase [Planctomycetaceae bacterium]|nr:arylsulfatase [Planctomycetaceae bacterium]